ncbi:MAG: osmoprotectant NAGGN system M42 family peptidase [Magnetococcales bacterium]|nr:osmoprotectant NAGGN system M42 family peptidase [Magnetococcales bacterium]
MTNWRIDRTYLANTLKELLEIPSPTGMTDGIVHYVSDKLSELGLAVELTRRGAIRATLKGKYPTPNKAIVSHLDTLGAMVKQLKPNGRVGIVPIGTWSARFAEGARVTLFCDDDLRYRGTILPLKASGHAYNKEVDTQPCNWQNLEIRLNVLCNSVEDLQKLNINVGDHVAVDPVTEFQDDGFINARHLDDKAGVAAVLTALKTIKDEGMQPAVDCHPLFTISEETGTGASSVLHQDVAEMVAVDNGVIAPDQNTHELGVTIAMHDASGLFDWHLTRHLLRLCKQQGIPHSRDVFAFYRSDAAAALEAGNDIRTALICFGLDGSHGWERTHLHSIGAVSHLLVAYMLSKPVFLRDTQELSPIEEFPTVQVHQEGYDVEGSITRRQK